jgi:hypothetical protein
LPADAAETSLSKSQESQIAGPEALAVRQVSLRGPFARVDTLMQLRPTGISVVNAGSAPLIIERITLDPLHRDGSGTTVPGSLCLHADNATSPLPPGTSLNLTLQGTVPAQPGKYSTIARILAASGASFTMPVSFDIPAAPFWGVLCMLFGLFLLGTVNLLGGEGTIKTRLHDALQARQDIHTVLEANPAPQSRAVDVETMDHDFDAGIASLSRRRQLSVVDHRETEAQPYLDEAQKLATKLRADLAGLPRGAAEVEDVQHDWNGLQSTLKQIAELPAGMPAEPEQGLAGKLDAFLLGFRTRFLHDPAAIVVAEMSTEFGRMALEQSAGEGDAARELALNTRLWLQRSALALNRALTLYRTAVVQAGWMLNTDRVLRDRAVHDDMSADDRQAVLSLLDQAGAQLDGDAGLENFREANRLIDAAWTAQVRGSANMTKIRVNEAIAAVNQRTDYADVQTLQTKLQETPGPHTLEMKQAGLSQILSLWQAHVAQVDEPQVRDKMQGQIDSMRAIVASGKLLELSAPYRRLLNDWAAWNGHLVQQAADKIEHPRCLEYYADLQRNTGQIEAVLRQLPAGPQLDTWDRVLDQIRLDMQREGPDAEIVTPNCMNALLGIGSRINTLSAAIFTASLVDVPIPALTRLRLAQASGIAAAVEITEANKDRPRTLTIETATPLTERVVGRELTFTVRGADPVWGPSTAIRVDFGDGKPPFSVNAEALRQGRQIVHTYDAPLTVHLTVTATEDPKPGETTGTVLGQGTSTILISPSPVTGAQILADEFINLRFALALLIALTVYYWRYHSRATTFGARGYDYVEAFALGFAADVAVSNLPQAVAGFAP